MNVNLRHHLSPESTEKLAAATRFVTRLLQRFPWAMPLVGFISGAASFFLVEREKDAFAQFIAFLMLASWVWLALEKLLRRGVQRWFGAPLPSPVLSFFTQMVHQESLFFVIPFFTITTAWNTGQLVFTSLLMLFALISIVDPIYYRWAERRWLYFIFHGVTFFAVLLTALPIIFQLPTPKTYLLALGVALILSLPAVVRALPLRWWGRGLVAIALALLTIGVGIYTRPWIPPATLRLTKVAVTDKIDDRNRAPERELKVITDEQLRQGLYAYTAIRAPRGLRERIYHEWRRNGRTVDRIALDINGGREAGYRAWTHKLNFPPYPAGKWEVHVLTEANQVIGILRFEVVKSDKPTIAPPPEPMPATEEESAVKEEPFATKESDESLAPAESPTSTEQPKQEESPELQPIPDENENNELTPDESLPAEEQPPADNLPADLNRSESEADVIEIEQSEEPTPEET
jgi:Uncharacterized membrane protein, required for N-linked glycosylation